MAMLALPRRGPFRSTLLRHLTLAVLGGLALFLLTSGASAYRDFQIAAVGYYVVAVAGLTVLTGLNGQISLGHGALMMVGAYTAGLLLERDNPLPLAVVLADTPVVVETELMASVSTRLSSAQRSAPVWNTWGSP